MGVELTNEPRIIIKNKSFSFLLPLIGLKNYNNIINTYLGDVNEDLFNNKLYILCTKPNNFIKINKNFIKEYNVDEGIMYVCNIGGDILPEYNNFIKGKYSHFREHIKEALCKHVCRNTIKKPHQTQMYSILYRTKARKEEIENKLDVKLAEDAEYASIFNEEAEIYGL